MQAIVFNKKGAEIKTVVKTRISQLQERLDRRNQNLNEFLKDTAKVRSYMIRSTQTEYGHGYSSSARLYSNEHISSEEVEEITQLCQRISEIEGEINKLSLVVAHLDDEQTFELSLSDLKEYGFSS